MVEADAAATVLQGAYRGKPVALTIHALEFSVHLKDQLWVQLPVELVLDAKVEDHTLTVSMLAPPARRESYQHLVSREQWSERHKQKVMQALRLFSIQLKVHAPEATVFAAALLKAAYPRTTPHRRVLVLCNPQSGRGHGKHMLDIIVTPVLRRAGCMVTVIETDGPWHAYRVCQTLSLQDYDVLACVGGDGTVHEVVNGLASRSDVAQSMQLPLAPIPCGSGNGLYVSLHGAENGFVHHLACLNVIKGTPHVHELMCITQSAQDLDTDAWPYTLRGHAADGREYVQYYSFMSQTIGIMADLDIGTEAWRCLGDMRFVLGYLLHAIRNRPCHADVDVWFGDHGTNSLTAMRQRSDAASHSKERQRPIPPAPHRLRCGSVLDPISPSATAYDPAMPDSALVRQGWMRLATPLSFVYTGKVPYVARTLMAFPYTHPHDGLIDVVTQERSGTIFMTKARTT
ncbi:sphingosine kinase [Malassezia equina]|uniref:Sphingosine kinase n=1 Tax=Malassezia equina TaxID=1381935 RepID=A0AAF0ECL8_9BASI|nr:sphingosine kinase [Malassezia equina]